MASLQVLDLDTAQMVRRVCDAIVPGSARVHPEVYVDALLARMDEPQRGAAIAAFASLSDGEIGSRTATPGFLWARALAIEAFYSRLRRAGRRRRRRVGRDRLQHPPRHAVGEGLVLPRHRVNERFDVVVVGSGAGGGIVAGELAERGRRVLLLECGPHRTAADFTRWEAKATYELFWPIRFALIDGGAGGAVAMLGGRCVGGSTTVNTKVALRAHAKDLVKWHEASGLVGAGGAPFGTSDLAPHYDRVEARLGVRERNDWPRSVRTVEGSFRALGSELESVRSYTDGNCMRCGSCLQGCPTNAGKSTLNTYIHDAWAAGLLELRADARVERVVIEDGEAKGVEYVEPGRDRRARRCRSGRRCRRDAEHAPAACSARACPTRRAAA